ncbi:MAG: hypothetical protein D3M94_15000 [Rhodocyclales bacterium GT-UBC]|nr:MAG: hypothetical protein D3M94_15000 [Rhodocyclales bacterium GT-UBC]
MGGEYTRKVASTQPVSACSNATICHRGGRQDDRFAIACNASLGPYADGKEIRLEQLLAPFLLTIPLALLGTLWRVGQLLVGKLPPPGWRRWLRVGLSVTHLLCAGELLLWTGRCIWPHQCGEGFASGMAAGAVGVMGALWALCWLISEGLMLFCHKPASPVGH